MLQVQQKNDALDLIKSTLRLLISLDPNNPESWELVRLLILGQKYFYAVDEKLPSGLSWGEILGESIKFFSQSIKQSKELITPGVDVEMLLKKLGILDEINQLELPELKRTIARVRYYIQSEQVKEAASSIVQATMDTEFPLEKVKQTLDLLQTSLKLTYEPEIREISLGSVKETDPVWESETKFESPIPDLINYFGTRRFYIIAGTWGEGKSFFASNLGYFFAKQNHRVLHLTLEIPLQEVVIRYLALATGAELDEVASWPKEKVISTLNSLQGIGCLSIVDAAGIDVAWLKSYLAARRFDIVLIDYLDLVSPDTTSLGGGSLFRDYAKIAADLYNLAKEEKICLIATSQLNRAAALTPDPTGANLSRSIGKAEAADGIIILKQVSSNGMNYLKLYTDKLRYWKRGQTVYVPIDFSRGRIMFSKAVKLVDSALLKKSSDSEVLAETKLL